MNPKEDQHNVFSSLHASAALRWFDTVSRDDQWGLSVTEQIELLGGIKLRTYHNWRRNAQRGDEVLLSRDTLERLSLLLGIYAGLKMIAPNDRSDIAKQWFSAPNTGIPFCGMSPKQYVISIGTIGALYEVRRYLDAVICGGYDSG